LLAFIGFMLLGAILTVASGDEEEAAETTTTTEATTTTVAPTTTEAPTTTTTIEQTTTTTTQATTTTEYVPTDEDIEDLYVLVVRGIVQPEYPTFARVTDEQIVGLGHNTCDVVTEAKADGTPPSDTVMMLALIAMDNFDHDDMGASIVGATLGAAPEAFCPEHLGYVEDMIDYALNF